MIQEAPRIYRGVVHNDIQLMTYYALNNAKNHNCNYNVIIMNPNESGEFDTNAGSTYECVRDSYFEKPRPNAKLLFKTDDLNNK